MNEKKEQYVNSTHILGNLFCFHSILSNDDKISAYVNMYVVFVTLVCFSENGCGKRLFWSDLGSRFRESGGAPLPRIPRGTPEDK